MDKKHTPHRAYVRRTHHAKDGTRTHSEYIISSGTGLVFQEDHDPDLLDMLTAFEKAEEAFNAGVLEALCVLHPEMGFMLSRGEEHTSKEIRIDKGTTDNKAVHIVIPKKNIEFKGILGEHEEELAKLVDIWKSITKDP